MELNYDICLVSIYNFRWFSATLNLNYQIFKSFSLSGNQGHGWSKAYVFIGQQNSYTIDIKSTVGTSPNSRIAFDDIAMVHCHDTAPAACTDFEYQCPTSTMCIPVEKKCNGIQDCSDGSDEQGCRK